MLISTFFFCSLIRFSCLYQPFFHVYINLFLLLKFSITSVVANLNAFIWESFFLFFAIRNTRPSIKYYYLIFEERNAIWVTWMLVLILRREAGFILVWYLVFLFSLCLSKVLYQCLWFKIDLVDEVMPPYVLILSYWKAHLNPRSNRPKKAYHQSLFS